MIDPVLFFRVRSVRDVYTARKRQERYGSADTIT